MTQREEMRLETPAGDPASRLGLAGSPDMTESRCVHIAYTAGINTFFFYNLSFDAIVSGLRHLVKNHRQSILIATGAETRHPGELQTYLDAVCHRLDIDTIDIFLAEYASPEENVEIVLGDVLDLLHRWKAEGRIRYAGISAHSRDISLRAIQSGRIDVLMHRYNMAHRKSEDRVLPAAQAAGIPVISFTNTRWGSLLKGHPAWNGPVPSAADCYRFVLNHPAVQVALTAPMSVAQLKENLPVLSDQAPPTPEQMAQWKTYGDLIYGTGGDAFETRWP